MSLSSINSRIIIGAIVIVSSFIILTGITLGRTFYRSAYSALEDSLTGQLYLLMADREFIPLNSDTNALILANSPLPYKHSNNNAYAQLSAYISQSDGTILWQSSAGMKHQLPAIIPLSQGKVEHGKKVFQQYQLDGKDYISLSVAIFWDLESGKFPLIYHISDDLTLLNKRIAEYQHSLWNHLVAMSIALFIALFLILRWGLKPLREVEQEIKSIEQGQQALLEKTYPEELVPLTHNINQLILYERKQQVRYQNALADLAHSLKTPLAIIQGQQFNAANPHHYTHTISDAIARMNSIIEYQLQRASASTPTSHIQYLQLSSVSNTLINTMEKIYRDKHITFITDIATDSQFKISEGDFMEVLGNLLDNACKWCNKTVHITIRQDESTLHLNVTDDGPGIAAEMLSEISKRGVRADELTPGHGVGLAIVSDIIDVYNGKIEFIPAQQGGLDVHLYFKI